ncbi:MAG: amino acid adenylation domain-containing protein, partial [Vulcanimicrobiaceae bacterium]
MLVAILAVLKAGGAYVPLDSAYPVDRLQYMLEDSHPAIILTHDEVSAETATLLRSIGLPTIDLRSDAARWANASSENPERGDLSPKNLAYVIYTSGSTGKPKGVMLEHQGACNLSAEQGAHLDIGPGSRVLQAVSFNFDASVHEWMLALTHGACLCIVDYKQVLAGETLLRAISEYGITHAVLLPAVLSALPQGARMDSLRVLMSGGDVVTQNLVQRWAQGRRFFNIYGPTEATVIVAWHECRESDERAPAIGTALANTRLYVLDESGSLAPIGVPGELHVGGVQVARGYLNQPDLTAERFVASPFVTGDRLYKTGDQVRYRADGILEFLGRMDFQVKIRGFRLELGEIEANLLDHESVSTAAIIAREDAAGEKRLVAYYTRNNAACALTANELRTYLLNKLPEYMVPSAYVELVELPVSANGKLDRATLPAPSGSDFGASEYAPPVGKIETVLASIWCDVLDIERVSRFDNFFALGGHSLLAVRVRSKLRDFAGLDVTLAHFFARPVLCELAASISMSGARSLPEIGIVERVGPLPLSSAQQRMWLLSQLDNAGRAYHIHSSTRLSGQVDASALGRALLRIVERHEALRTAFTIIDTIPAQSAVLANEAFALRVLDLRTGEDESRNFEIILAEESSAPFDLESGRLFRALLLQIDDQDFILSLTMHHIASDGWSMGLLARELSVLYDAYLRQAEDPLPPQRVQYADFAVWQRDRLADGLLENEMTYWKRALEGIPPVLELPTDRPRPARQDFVGARVVLDLDVQLCDELKQFSTVHETTMFAALLTAWGTLMWRLSAQDDIVIGTPVANRLVSDVEDAIGLFVNTLAIRLDFSIVSTVTEIVAQTKARAIEAQTHQELPFEYVVDAVNPPRSLAHSPVFQSMFAWQNNESAELQLHNVSAVRFELPHTIAKFDLMLSLREADGRIIGGIEYASAIFDDETVQRYADYFRRILKSMVSNSTQSLNSVALVAGAEHNDIFASLDTLTNYPSNRSIQSLVSEHAARTPFAIAIESAGRQVTYAELNARANRLARYLRSRGVGPNCRVAVCSERSAETIIAFLAVLKAGAAYVPLDIANPADRLGL